MSFKKREQTGNSLYAYLNKGKVITYEEGNRREYDSVEGYVMGIDFEMKKFGEKEYEAVLLFMQDKDNNRTILVFPLESGYGASFCKIAKNVDWKLPLEISCKLEAGDNGKNYSSLFIKQPNEQGKWANLKHAYTSKEPGKMPPGEEKTDRNGKYIDYSARNEFFRKLLIDYVHKAIKKAWPDFDPAKAKDKTGAPASSDEAPF